MKAASTAMKAHLGLDCTTLSNLWKVKRQDGTIMGFTDHDVNITYNDGINTVTYEAATGFTPTATESASDLGVDNLEVSAFLDSAAITEADLQNGLYNFAAIEIRTVNWADLTMSDVKVRKGTLGQVTVQNGTFNAEIRGLAYLLGTTIGSTFGPVCRAEFGDTKCKVDITTLQQSGSVNTSADQQHLVPASGLLMVGTGTPTNPAPSGWFNDGVITFTSGANNGFNMEVTNFDGTILTLFEPLPFPMAHGDTFTIEPGCNKGTDCSAKWQGVTLQDSTVTSTSGNIKNKRSEDFIPGQDSILQYPDANGG